jgi:hypothetical protein
MPLYNNQISDPIQNTKEVNRWWINKLTSISFSNKEIVKKTSSSTKMMNIIIKINISCNSPKPKKM